MRERGGFFAVFAALTAAAFHVGSVSSASKPSSQTGTHTSGSIADHQPAETALLGVFEEFDKNKSRKFHSPLDSDGNCLPEDQARQPVSPGSTTFDWVIATVPDPEHTNLKLDFDHEVESIQVAAQSSGYQFERYWFPWRAEEGPPKDLPESAEFGESSNGVLRVFLSHQEDSRREDLPGVLLFHRAEDSSLEKRPLAIFLVGETPNSGIVHHQFATAVCYGRSLSPANAVAGRTLRIIGPGFSGGFPSLAKLTEEYAKDFHSLSVRTWTSGLTMQEHFKETVAHAISNVDLETVRTPGVYALKAFISYVRQQWRDNNPIILLTEEGTAFGAQIGDGKLDVAQKTYTLRFPRNISTLRNATETDTHLPGFGDDSKRPEMPHNGLTFSLKGDEHASSDTPVFSKQQSPVAQESVLFSIGSMLKANVVHYVGVIASDPLDTLFLTRYLHSACPNLRIFTLESDLLFEHGSDSADYQGTLSVTSAPLFPMSQLWSGSRGELYAFPSSNFEAIYNATNELLMHLPGSPTYSSSTHKALVAADFRDFRDPFGGPGKQTPPLWLTVAARTGFQPIAVLKPQESEFAAHDSAKNPRLVPQYWPGWGYSFGLLLCCCLLYWFAIIWATPCGNRTLAIFSTKSDEPNPLPRAFYLYAIGCSLSALLAIWMVVPGTIIAEQSAAWDWRTSLLALQSFVLFSLGASAVVSTLAFTEKRHSQKGKDPVGQDLRVEAIPKLAKIPVTVRSSIAVFALYAFAIGQGLLPQSRGHALSHLTIYFWAGWFAIGANIATSLRPLCDALLKSAPDQLASWRYRWRRIRRMPYIWATCALSLATLLIVGYAVLTIFWRAGKQSDFLAACRSLDLTSGVSPLIPVSLLLISLMALAFVQLRRVAYYEDHYPGVPKFKGDLFCPELRTVVKTIRERTHLLSCHYAHVAAYILLGAVLANCLLQPSHQTFEDLGLETLILALSIASGFFLVLVWIRFLIIWSAFGEFLQQLERHPLRHVFSLLPRGFVWSPVWQGGGKKRTHVAVTRSLECLLALKNHKPINRGLRAAVQLRIEPFQKEVEKLLRKSAKRERAPQIDHRRLENNLLIVAEQAAHHLESREWSLGGYEVKSELLKKEDTKDALRVDPNDFIEAEPETICGELVAYRLLAFINYVLWQLDNLVSYLSLGFLLLAIALNSYTFRSSTIIDWILVAMFIIMTTGIVFVFAQADRDAILSRITGTEEGKLDRHFFTHLISYGALPALVLAATHFPTVGRFFFSWVKPALEAIH